MGQGRRWVPQAAGARRLVIAAAIVTALVAGVAALVVAGPSTAQAEEGEKRIVTAHSRKCLEVRPRAYFENGSVVQNDCTGAAAQRFTVEDVGDGHVRLGLYDDDMCLGLLGDATRGSDVIPRTCEDSVSQHFEQEPLGDDGRVQLVSRSTGMCVGVSGGGREPDLRVVLDLCTGADHQILSFEPVGGVAHELGAWSPVIEMPLIPVAASALPDGKVLVWSANDRFSFADPYAYGYTQTAVFDPNTGTTDEELVSRTGHDMFCPGIAHLPDGRILVNGGSSAFDTSIYDPASGGWESADAMHIPRGYQGTTLTTDGRAFTLGGSFSGGFLGKDAEIWSEDEGWRRLPGIEGDPFIGPDPFPDYRGDNHLWLFAWGDRIFHAGPTRAMHWLDLEGDGAIIPAGVRADDGFAINGTAVMYEPGRILTVGGAPAYDWGEATTNATVIDITGDEVEARTVGSMTHARGFHNAAVLPTGEVVVTGGVPITGTFEDFDSVFETEIWDPETETFSPAAHHAVPRNYHSFSLLLADGRVVAGGGGLCGDCDTNHPNVEIFSPPYLFAPDGSLAPRPVIDEAPTVVEAGTEFEITADGAESFALVRLSSATHSVNLDQRRIPLEAVSGGEDGERHVVAGPADDGSTLPGLYYLFALSGDGVPSHAAIVQVSVPGAGS